MLKTKTGELQKPAMSAHLMFILFISFFIPSKSKLTTDYYDKSCPDFSKIIQQTITDKQINNPTTAAGTLRIFFHDCIINGCDASILITSTSSLNKAERDADLNLSLPGDGFDVIVRAKTALELKCPGIVSCSDILSVSTRDLIVMVGGPYYQVRLGRKDGLLSNSSYVEGNLPLPTMKISEIINLFGKRGFTIEEMVALSGAHTIGFSHCKEFANRVYGFSKKSPIDPSLNPKFADRLKESCSNYKKDPTMSVFNDIMTPGKFDNMFYQNLPRGLGLLESDSGLFRDSRTRPFVERFATNQTAFFNAFSYSMEKLSRLGVKVGKNGEVRRRCDAFNSVRS